MILRAHIHDVIVDFVRDENAKALTDLAKAKNFFIHNWMRIFVTQGWTYRLLEAWLKLFSPGFWTYLFSFVRSETEIKTSLPRAKRSAAIEGLSVPRSRLDDIRTYAQESWREEYIPSYEEIFNLLKDSKTVNVSTIDWKDKPKIKEQSAKRKRLTALLESNPIWEHSLYAQIDSSIIANHRIIEKSPIRKRKKRTVVRGGHSSK